MPYIIGQVSETSDGTQSPCMDFQVFCTNKPAIENNITYAPPKFWVTVPQDEYQLQIVSANGGTAQAVAKALTTFGGVRVTVAIPEV